MVKETKQTAVDWLIQVIIPSSTLPIKTINEFILKAKAMEKEQHKLTWERGSYSLLDHGSGEYFEDYYNETYGK